MKNKLIILATLIFIVFSILINAEIIRLLNDVTALSGKYKTDTANDNPTPYHFVLIVPDKHSEAWKLLKRGAAEEAEKQKAVLESIELQNMDTEEQKKAVEMSIAARVDGIIIDTLNNKGLIELIDKSQEKRIPILTVNNDSAGSRRLMHVGNDYYREGMKAADIITKNIRTDSGYDVAVILGSEDDVNYQHETLRLNGFMDGIKNNLRVNVLKVNVNGSPDEGKKQLLELLQGNPSLKGIFAANELNTINLAQAIRETKRQEKYIVVGVGDKSDVLNYIRNGIIFATFRQDAFKMGEMIVENLVKFKKNDEIEKIYNIEPIVVDKKNIDVLTNR